MAHLPELAKDYCGECPCGTAPLDGEQYGCVCMEAEAVLRCYAEGWCRTALSPAQREVCLTEIGAVEGYDRADYEQETDQALARGVLWAWLDFCRDKGLL